MKDGTPALTMNGLTPGPPIVACVNDIIIVEVTNRIPGQDLAIHWHGIEQKGTPYMDGVPMITQCPISYGMTYKYAFRASSPGTFFYHADSGNGNSLILLQRNKAVSILVTPLEDQKRSTVSSS